MHEVIFYALAPAVAIARCRYAFLVIAYCCYALGCLFPDEDRSTLPAFFLDYAAFFAVGVVAYHDRARIARFFIVKPRTFAVLCACGYVLMTFLLRVSDDASFLIACAMALLLIFNFLRHDFRIPGLEGLGAMSYTIYVTHFAALMLWGLMAYQTGWVNALPAPGLWFWATCIPFVLFVALLFYAGIEHPTLLILKRMRQPTAPGRTSYSSTSVSANEPAVRFSTQITQEPAAEESHQTR